MKQALVLLVLVAAGCSGVSQPVTGSVYDEFGCKVGCDRCAPEAQCISSPYVPACLPRCTGPLDCGGGEKCSILAGNETRSPVCLAAQALVVCHAPDCQLAPRCRDDMTQLKPLPKTFSGCGWELVPCDNGCDSATGSCK